MKKSELRELIREELLKENSLWNIDDFDDSNVWKFYNNFQREFNKLEKNMSDIDLKRLQQAITKTIK